MFCVFPDESLHNRSQFVGSDKQVLNMLVKCCAVTQGFGDLSAGGKEVILVLTYHTTDPDELPLDLIFIEMQIGRAHV